MLSAGAQKVYFAKVRDEGLLAAFGEIMKQVPSGTPVICESPALRNFAEPGIFIIMSSDSTNILKDISYLQSLPHVTFKLEEIDMIDKLQLAFEDGSWIFR